MICSTFNKTCANCAETLVIFHGFSGEGILFKFQSPRTPRRGIWAILESPVRFSFTVVAPIFRKERQQIRLRNVDMASCIAINDHFDCGKIAVAACNGQILEAFGERSTRKALPEANERHSAFCFKDKWFYL